MICHLQDHCLTSQSDFRVESALCFICNQEKFNEMNMIGLDTLNNLGIKYIGDKSALDTNKKTLIVSGVARGGTSLVAGVLHHLGVFTGELSTEPVFEDLQLALLFEKGNLEKAHEVINKYNTDYHVWGFKRPGSINYNKNLYELCHNPIYLFIFKDIFSVSNRNNISMNLDIMKGLQSALDDYNKILQFIGNNPVNGFLLSYEKLIGNKEIFVDTLVELIGVENISDMQIQEALDYITPNPKAYIDASRITKGIGQIGSVDKKHVIGWGKYIASNDPAMVELYINDILEKTIEAKEFRPHALEKNIHPTGHCGYLFRLKNELKQGDKVSVKLSKEVNFLKNSGWIYSPPPN